MLLLVFRDLDFIDFLPKQGLSVALDVGAGRGCGHDSLGKHSNVFEYPHTTQVVTVSETFLSAGPCITFYSHFMAYMLASRGETPLREPI